MNWYWAHQIALALTTFSAIGLAVWLWWNGARQVQLRLLALFVLGTAAWAAGHMLVATGVAGTAQFGRWLLSLAYLNPAVFIHFVLALVAPFAARWHRHILWVAYASSSLGVALALKEHAGVLLPWREFPLYYRLSGGLPLLASGSLALSMAAYGLLLLAYRHYRQLGQVTHSVQILWVLVVGFWGLICSSGISWPSLGLDWPPFTVVLLPSFHLLLVYGITRYRILKVNRWLDVSIGWVGLALALWLGVSLLLVIAAQLGVEALAAVPWWQLWLVVAVAVSLSLLLQSPIQQLITRLIYSDFSASQRADWQSQLEYAEQMPELLADATALGTALAQRPVQVVEQSDLSIADKNQPAIICQPLQQSNLQGPWRCHLQAWEGASPGVWKQAENLAELLAANCQRVQQRQALLAAQAQQLRERHITELGHLALTVAHDLRNPLNIISMASATASPELKSTIGQQLQRADRLIADLLDYSAELKLRPQNLQLQQQLTQACSQLSLGNVTVQQDLQATTVWADAHRLQQVLINLLDNARHAVQAVEHPCIKITSTMAGQQLHLRIADNGPGVPTAMQARLFEPFVSQRTGGHGLGLAIVRRLIQAHGGQVHYMREGNWSCFDMNLDVVNPQTSNNLK